MNCAKRLFMPRAPAGARAAMITKRGDNSGGDVSKIQGSESYAIASGMQYDVSR